MGNILIFLQQQSGKILKGSLCALECANQLKDRWSKGHIVGLVLGDGATAAAEEALGFGLEKVIFSEDSILKDYKADVFAQAALEAGNNSDCDVFICAATSSGKDMAPRVAAAWEAGQASDIVAVNSDGTLKRPMYAGDLFADVEILTNRKVLTVRSTAFAPAVRMEGASSKEELKAAFSSLSEVISYDVSKLERPELADAEVVVSGGRALQSEENFKKYVFPLADALGAAVGASRAAVDSGYAPNDWQVGQTGKVVAPTLYIAVGISGAIQHVAGMKDSKVIVAINKDGDAPIFEIADYGLVGDLYQILPELTEAVKKVKAA